MKQRNIFIKIEYDGSAFSGWQRQTNAKTVQGTLESVLSKVCAHEVKINGTSRTDAGVHALGQCATFVCQSNIPTEKIAFVANNIFGGGINGGNKAIPIRIVEIEDVPFGFHARYDSKWKTYRYVLRFGKDFDIFIFEGFKPE